MLVPGSNSHFGFMSIFLRVWFYIE
jgi:hypothetical protein